VTRASRSESTDEHEAFDRPQRRTRPRTKDRPDYSAADIGRVTTIDRGRYRCRVGEGASARQVSAAKARVLGRAQVIVGDRVRLVGDTSGGDGTLARLVGVLTRTTVLRRTADDDDPYERPIVANADQLVIVTALADPPPRTGMIDRILVAGFDARLDPLLCLTKADLAPPEELIAAYAPLGVRICVVQPEADLAELQRELAGRVSVFIGHSGVGKSTLVNRLIPGVGRAVGIVNQVTGRGRQTSTSAIALALPHQDDTEDDAGWVIDTPGIRSFGLSHVTIGSIVAAFGDLSAVAADCPRGCQHIADSPECALDVATAGGTLSQARVDSFRRILTVKLAGDQPTRG